MGKKTPVPFFFRPLFLSRLHDTAVWDLTSQPLAQLDAAMNVSRHLIPRWISARLALFSNLGVSLSLWLQLRAGQLYNQSRRMQLLLERTAMFGFRKPKPPLGTFETAWIEYRMQWLIERFGLDRLCSVVVVLPNADFFPEDYRGTFDDARRIMDQLCDYMGVDGSRLELEVHDETTLPTAVGHYDASDGADRKIIRVRDTVLADPQELIAVLAHELSHEVLLGGKYMSGGEYDHEWVTDLLPVFFGLGIFSANAVLRDKSETFGTMTTWSIRRVGYLPARMHGYALALFAWLRQESAPDWYRYLRPDAASVFRKALRYLDRADDTLLDRDTGLRSGDRRDNAQLRRWLCHDLPSVRLAAMWDITALGVAETAILCELAECLSHRDPAIRAEAARTLGNLQAVPDRAAENLIARLHDRDAEVRAAAAFALGMVHVELDNILEEIVGLLDDCEANVVHDAAGALASYGRQAESYASHLMPALQEWLVQCRYDIVDDLITTLTSIAEDPKAMINEYFAVDEELHVLALRALEDWTSQRAE